MKIDTALIIQNGDFIFIRKNGIETVIMNNFGHNKPTLMPYIERETSEVENAILSMLEEQNKAACESMKQNFIEKFKESVDNLPDMEDDISENLSENDSSEENKENDAASEV